MAHPDHDQIIGRLAGARLRGAADGRAVSSAAGEAHPDAETWAAYVDGGLRPDEVVALETHLADCRACRRLVAALAPEESAGATAAREVDAPAADRGVVIPFPRRPLFVWMAAAAGLFMAVTLWSVSRLGRERPVASVAVSTPSVAAEAPFTAGAAPPPADAARRSTVPRSPAEATAVDRAAGGTAAAQAPPARHEQDKRKLDSRRDGLAGGRIVGAAQAPEAKAALKQAAQSASPAATGRDIPLQANSAAGGARPRGPIATQQANQANQPASQPAGNAAPLPATPVAVAAAPVAAPAPPPAPAKAAPAEAAAEARERRADEAPVPALSESVTITTSGDGRASTRPQPTRRQAAGAAAAGAGQGQGQAAKDEAAQPAALGYAAATTAAAPLSFAEPGGLLRWRIVDGRRLDSSSDGGTTWNERYTSRDERLRAGTAPAIDSAWAVGERGLVLRLAVPGGWAAVARPTTATLVAVAATGTRAARVTAADGGAFETADGGATWTPATPGAGPQ